MNMIGAYHCYCEADKHTYYLKRGGQHKSIDLHRGKVANLRTKRTCFSSKHKPHWPSAAGHLHTETYKAGAEYKCRGFDHQLMGRLHKMVDLSLEKAIVESVHCEDAHIDSPLVPSLM
jgi:hypothetical protein